MSTDDVKAVVTCEIPLETYGVFDMTVFRHVADSFEHFILEKKPRTDQPLVRIHSECLTGDLFGSLKCDCGRQLHASLARIAVEGGVFIYLRQEGRGIGLVNKLKAYALQAQGLDTVEANEALGLPVDNREYTIAAIILKKLGIDCIRLMTNNPQKIAKLIEQGIDVVERIGLETQPTPENYDYLKIKQQKLGHWLALDQERAK